MTEITKKRRLWRWLTIAALLAAVTGAFAWPHRPLNQLERSLVGRWSDSAGDMYYHLSADRRFLLLSTSFPSVRGTWAASGSTLYLTDGPDGSPWKNPSRYWLAWFKAPTVSAKIRLSGSDRLWFGDDELARQRD